MLFVEVVKNFSVDRFLSHIEFGQQRQVFVKVQGQQLILALIAIVSQHFYGLSVNSGEV